MKLFKITYFSDEWPHTEKIGIQYTRDEELVDLLKLNELNLEEKIEVKELDLKENNSISECVAHQTLEKFEEMFITNIKVASCINYCRANNVPIEDFIKDGFITEQDVYKYRKMRGEVE